MIKRIEIFLKKIRNTFVQGMHFIAACQINMLLSDFLFPPLHSRLLGLFWQKFVFATNISLKNGTIVDQTEIFFACLFQWGALPNLLMARIGNVLKPPKACAVFPYPYNILHGEMEVCSMFAESLNK